MAQLQVDDLIFHFACVRTESLTVTPVRDPSDRFVECVKTSLEIVAVVNKVCLATNKLNPKGVGVGNEGDSLPAALRNISDYLMRQRRTITYTVGGVTVLDVPRKRQDGVRFFSDVKGGPFPQAARFTNFAGEKTAVLHFHVDVYDQLDPDGVFLSHNWDSTAAIDATGYTTRTIRGRLAFRRDVLDRVILNGNDDARLPPDFFRNTATPPISQGMRRVGVTVNQPATGDELIYVVIDREVDFGIGQDNGASRITGSVHTGVDLPVKNLKESLQHGGAIAKKGLALDIEGLIELGLHLSIPVNFNRGQFRVEGKKGSNKRTLGQLAAALLVDRFTPLFQQGNGGGVVRGLSLSHYFDSDGNPAVEVTMEFYGVEPTGPSKQLNNDVVFRSSNDFLADNGGVFMGPNFSAPRLTGGSDNRGTWLRAMLTQRLLRPTERVTPDFWPPDQGWEPV